MISFQEIYTTESHHYEGAETEDCHNVIFAIANNFPIANNPILDQPGSYIDEQQLLMWHYT